MFWQNLKTMKTQNMKAEIAMRAALDVYKKGTKALADAHKKDGLVLYANCVEAMNAARALTTMKAKKHMKAMKTMKAMKAMRLK